MKNATLSSTTVSAPMLAAFLGVTSSTVREYQARGIIEREKGRFGKFPLQASVRLVLEHLREQASRSTRAPKLTDARTRKADADASLREIELAKARNEMIDVRDVIAMGTLNNRAVRATLLSLKSRIGSRLPHLSRTDIAEIDTEIREAMSDLSKGGTAPDFEKEMLAVKALIEKQIGKKIELASD